MSECKRVLGNDGPVQQAQFKKLGPDTAGGVWPKCRFEFSALSVKLPYSNGEIYDTSVFEMNTNCRDGPAVESGIGQLLGRRLTDSYNILSHIDHATFEKLKRADPAVIAKAFEQACAAE